MLSMRYRYYCSMVCKTWYGVFFSPRVWRTLRIEENSFTYKRFHLYKGYERQISHRRVQMYLALFGRHLRKLTIEPISDFFNLFEFLNVLCCFCEFFQDADPLPELYEFEFSFLCETATAAGNIVLGTGGKLFAEIRRLLSHLKYLDTLRIHNLLLDSQDAIGLLEDVTKNCRDSLTLLEVTNATKSRYPLSTSGCFITSSSWSSPLCSCRTT